jgi:hypothetical protein
LVRGMNLLFKLFDKGRFNSRRHDIDLLIFKNVNVKIKKVIARGETRRPNT